MISLARKYRPSTFQDLAGQLHTSKALKNAIELGKISHAYLFFGARGVGKTSTARILARSINCSENGPSINPCGKCENCIEIMEGRNIDVIEMDAASNRGIEYIRELRENVRFSPMRSKYKIYIIDEVHMLTNEAFNALLKTLEEPPPHIIFIFATTEHHKIPETILSRCQVFAFKKFTNDEIIDRLKFILASEKIEHEDEALYAVATGGQGSMRDSISLLDRIIAYTAGEKITYQAVNEILNIVPDEEYLKLLEAVFSDDLMGSLGVLDNLHSRGYSLKDFLKNFLEFLKNLLLIKKGVIKEGTHIMPRSEFQRAKESVDKRDEAELILAFEVFYRLYGNWSIFNTSNSAEILTQLEIALIELIEKIKRPSVSTLLHKLSQLEKALSAGEPFKDQPSTPPQPSVSQQPRQEPEKKGAEPVKKENQAPSQTKNEESDRDIGSFLQKEFGGTEANEKKNQGIFQE